MLAWLRRILRFCILLTLVLSLGFFIFRFRFRGPIRELAQTQVKNATSDLMNDALDRQIQDGSLRYDRLVYFEKDLSGRITALKTNMSEVNRLKTDVLQLINDEILTMDSDKMGIPVGNLIFPEVFSGRGPVIPVHILSIRNSDAQFTSHFTEAGINQTRQQINMYISVDVSVLVLGKIDHFTVSSQVVVAETVIVGQVPDTFFQTGGKNGK